jgi:2-succinyl-5-enolpyruvyl-6-hydroxy-3-cyclohexene-1-carboxylate synthase
VIFPVLNNLVALCVRHGVRHAVLCPGSRSAPLTLAFTRNKEIRSWTFSDERSAAFIALGMAQQTETPVILVCTSGSAAYNFAPAVAEAFFQHVPLIVITADRPAEWIDQLDGQTIRQKNLYGSHVKKYFEFPHEYEHSDARWHAGRIMNEALLLATDNLKGPVHINAPFREPLYAAEKEYASLPAFPATAAAKVEAVMGANEWRSITGELAGFKKILVVAGQHQHDEDLIQTLRSFQEKTAWPIAGDILANLHTLPDFCSHSDSFLGQMADSDKKSLAPDLLITFGQSLIAKNLKLFLRKYKPAAHWHIDPGFAADTFQSLTKIIRVSPVYFFRQLLATGLAPSNETYTRSWTAHESKTRTTINKFFGTKRPGEFEIVQRVMSALPADCNLHLANSMTVRYANHVGLSEKETGIKVYSNRGTSGIDGCTSTATGHALSSTASHVLITGDMAFFYDRNAFWHNYPVPNLFVVVLNNHGGIIFNLIDGPSSQPEAAEFFITDQKLTAKALATEFGFSYFDAATSDLNEFFKKTGGTRILESNFSQQTNKDIFIEFKKAIRKIYET